jgi:hypothetical protein
MGSPPVAPRRAKVPSDCLRSLCAPLIAGECARARGITHSVGVHLGVLISAATTRKLSFVNGLNTYHSTPAASTNLRSGIWRRMPTVALSIHEREGGPSRHTRASVGGPRQRLAALATTVGRPCHASSARRLSAVAAQPRRWTSLSRSGSGAAPLSPNRPPATKARGYSSGYFLAWGYQCPGGFGTLVPAVPPSSRAARENWRTYRTRSYASC